MGSAGAPGPINFRGMRIYLVRHGQTFSNVEHLMDTRPPGAELTPRGRDQATAVGLELADLIDGVPRFLSSIAIRTQQTAMAAARAFEEARGWDPYTLPVEPTPGLHEILAGIHEMSGTDATRDAYTFALRGWLTGDMNACMEGGETLRDVLDRYQPILESVVGSDSDVVVFSHGAVIRTVTTHACGVDPDFAFTGYMPNCRFTVMEPTGRFGEWELIRWADLEL